jgi:hypothetical protein
MDMDEAFCWGCVMFFLLFALGAAVAEGAEVQVDYFKSGVKVTLTQYVANANIGGVAASQIVNGMPSTPGGFPGVPTLVSWTGAEWEAINSLPSAELVITGLEEAVIHRATVGIAQVETGDIDGQNGLSLADAILALKISAGLPLGDDVDIFLRAKTDPSWSGGIGLNEAIFVLRKVAGF